MVLSLHKKHGVVKFRRPEQQVLYFRVSHLEFMKLRILFSIWKRTILSRGLLIASINAGSTPAAEMGCVGVLVPELFAPDGLFDVAGGLNMSFGPVLGLSFYTSSSALVDVFT